MQSNICIVVIVYITISGQTSPLQLFPRNDICCEIDPAPRHCVRLVFQKAVCWGRAFQNLLRTRSLPESLGHHQPHGPLWDIREEMYIKIN